MRVLPIACLQDNYAYLLVGSQGRAVVIDPSEAGPVQAVLARDGLTLAEIWLTHHHFDHVGGVETLCDTYGALPVLGSAYDLRHARIPRQTRGLREGDALTFESAAVAVLDIPGHTLGAIAYVVDGGLFSGDTLFLAGCGRVFEGDMAMMQRSLAKLRGLSPGTRVYCGHEYTVGNLRFAHAVEPDNAAIPAALAAAQALRARGEPTVPGLLRDELATNPFLRWDTPALIAAAQQRGAKDAGPANVFGALRKAKDAF